MHSLKKQRSAHFLGNILPVLFFVAALALVAGCSRHEVVTTWKTPNMVFNKFNNKYSKVLVAAVIHDSGLVLRQQMEVLFVAELKRLGYNAAASSEEFGPRGLANLHQEETYQKLCGNGIDVVLTIALIDKKKEKQYMPVRVKYYSDLYYYNRIWNYQKFEGDLAASKSIAADQTRFAWEGILFDLATLQPLYSVQSRPFTAAVTESNASHYANEMVKLLLKKKVLARQKEEKEAGVKAF